VSCFHGKVSLAYSLHTLKFDPQWLQESFWGDLYGQTRQAWKKFFELESERLRDRYAG